MREENSGPIYDIKDDKKADILQAYVEQYYRMAMDHHTKAATVSQLLLVIVSASITMIGYDGDINGSTLDVMGAVMLLSIGIFGMFWTAKQMERYHYWEFIALKYRDELSKLVPELGDGASYKPIYIVNKNGRRTVAEHLVNKVNSKKKLPFFIYHIKDKYLWIGIYVFITFVGLGLTIYISVSILFC